MSESTALEAKLNVLGEVVANLGLEIFCKPPLHAVGLPLQEYLQNPSKFITVDIRSDEEREVSTMQGAISRQEFEANFKTAYADQDIICFDTVGYLAAAYCACLRKKGTKNIRYLADGGFLGYVLHGGVIVKPDGTSTVDIHTYNEMLSLLVCDTMNAICFEFPEEKLYHSIAYYSEILGIKIEI